MTRDMGMMTFHADILLGCVDICDGPLHVHFRLGVAYIGQYNYWASLTPSWNPFSGTGSIQADDAH